MNPSYANPENQSRLVPLIVESRSSAPFRTRCVSLSRIVLTTLAALQTWVVADISGKVFIDGNNNGVKDVSEVGYPFMPVRAFAVNAVTPTAGAVTDASGNYTITGLSAGAHRVEFLIPSGYSNGSFGVGSSTSIQFHNDGVSTANFGLYLAGQCGTDPDPRLIGTCGLIGSSAGISVVSWLYASESFPQPHSAPNSYNGVTHPHANDISSADVGVPWAMSRLPGTQLVAMSPISSPLAFFGTGGASGTTALYIADYSGANKSFVSSKPLVQLSSLGYTLAPEHPISAGALTRFGEYGLGGLDASSDGNFLYVTNLGRGNLLKIDISGVNYASLPATAPGAAQVTEIALPTTYAGFVSGTDGFFRATCVKEYAGSLYVAGTFDGSLRTDNSAVRIVVLKMNFSTNAFTEVFSFDPTTFVVGNFVSSSTPQSRWLSTNGGGGFDQPGGPLQPVLSDLAFDDYGALNFGITDRTVYHDGSSNQVGYTISTWRQADGSFVLESQKIRGPLTKSPTGGQFDSVGASGPGGVGMFYDQSCYHPYLYSGGLLNMQGKDSIIGGWADALDINAFGVRYNKPSSGEIFGGIHLGGGKQFAIVGVDAVCIPGPLEVGNYVWNDTNGNGIQDAGEPPLVGITVELVNASNSVIGTAATNSLGYFVFSADASRSDGNGADYGITALTTETAFTIRIPNISGGSQQGGLTGLYVTSGNQGTNDLIDNDGVVSGTTAVIAITTGTEGQNNHAYDFGFNSTPPPCAVTGIVVTPGTCNENGTLNDQADDYYTASVTVDFTSPPATGNLVLSGAALHSGNSVTTVTVGSTTSGTSHTYTGVKIKANNVANALTATFSADPACTLTINPAGVPNCSVPPCAITALGVTPGACNDNSTPGDSADDYYTASVTVTFSDKPSSGNLVLSGAALHSGNSVTTVAVGSTTSATTHVYAGVKIKANNVANALTATFSADVACTLTVNPAAVPNCSVPLCAITDLAVTPGACNDNATPNDFTDDYFTASVTATFANKPASGNLVLSGVALHSSNSVSTVAVGATTSATSHTFAGVKLKANNLANSLTATFSADLPCTLTVNTPMVPTCSVPLCDMVSLDVSPGACNDNGTPLNSADDYYVGNVTVAFSNKPSSGDLVLTGAALHATNSVTTVAASATNSSTSHVFVGVRIKANGSVNAVTATFSADVACTLTADAGLVPSCSVPPAQCCPQVILNAPQS